MTWSPSLVTGRFRAASRSRAWTAWREPGTGVIVIVNDNGWSIAENHGGLYRTLPPCAERGQRSLQLLLRALGLDYRFLADGNDEAAVERVLLSSRGIHHPVVLHLCTTKGAGDEPAAADSESWHHVGPFDVDTGADHVLPRNRCEDEETYAAMITGVTWPNWHAGGPARGRDLRGDALTSWASRPCAALAPAGSSWTSESPRSMR